MVNCTGLGAAGLVGDTAMFPVSGHVLRVAAPWVGGVTGDLRPESWAYCIPNRASLVLGSVDRKSLCPTTSMSFRKIRRCTIHQECVVLLCSALLWSLMLLVVRGWQGGQLVPGAAAGRQGEDPDPV